MRYWEDYAVGDEAIHGRHQITEAEIIEFAEKYDPQPFHTDPAKAVDGPYGGLIASGWHTVSLHMGMFVRNFDGAGMGSPGVEEIRWLVPVRPDDILTATSRIVDAWPSQGTPGRGTVFHQHETLNQDDEVVMRFKGRGFIARRPEQG